MAGRKKSRGSERKRRPEGELRQSQLITTYGPGSMVDLVDRAVVIGGLEHWGYGREGPGEPLDDASPLILTDPAVPAIPEARHDHP